MTYRQGFFIAYILLILASGAISYALNTHWHWFISGPILLIASLDMFQTSHSIRRNFPIIGNLRYLLEMVRPEIMQYFVETDTEGRPLNRIIRSMVYQRAKNVNDTSPFGTQLNVYEEGYEWLNHSMYPTNYQELDHDPRVLIGGTNCKKPYRSSLLNVSAMSFGSLSKNAILALNQGAKAGKFAHNTGEGGISDYHLKGGGDLIWQIGTGYFGCRTNDGLFNEKAFEEKAHLDQVKMIEVKISQGAKPGHGGILPGRKNTPEIAKIRGVEPYTDVLSPAFHRAFSGPEGLLNFIEKLRTLSGGKPVGFKICLGRKDEFNQICEAMKTTNIKPDFISIDGGEGGTGAAPVEFSNSLGTPMLDALAYAYDTLVQYGLKDEISLLASGKIISSFDIARTLAVGADACYSARAMMLALGCIQALKCNTNTCPVGVATQHPALTKGLHVPDKTERVTQYHRNTIHSFIEMLGAVGLTRPQQLSRDDIYRRVSNDKVLRYSQIYPYHRLG